MVGRYGRHAKLRDPCDPESQKSSMESKHFSTKLGKKKFSTEKKSLL